MCGCAGASGDGCARGGVGIHGRSRPPFIRRGPPASCAVWVPAGTRGYNQDWLGSGLGYSRARLWGEPGWFEGPFQLLDCSAISAQVQVCGGIAAMALPQGYLHGGFQRGAGIPCRARRQWMVRLNNQATIGDLLGRIKGLAQARPVWKALRLYLGRWCLLQPVLG